MTARLVSLAGWLLAGLLLAAGSPAGAAAPPASPRAVVEIGGASVVLVAANDRLYAFVDRLDDNAPVGEAVLSVGLAEASGADLAGLALRRVGDGLFVAPFSHAGRGRDAFNVSLASPAGSGDARAEIVYGIEAAPAPPPASGEVRGKALVALAAGAAGAALASAALLLMRRRRAHPAPRR